MTAANTNWVLHAAQGLGQISFGMSQKQVAQFDGIYGAVTYRKDENTHIEGIIAAMQHAAAGVPGIEENIRELRESASGLVTEYRDSSDLRLQYRFDRLSSILLPTDKDITFEERLVFTPYARDIIPYLAERNGGALYSYDTLLFTRLGIAAMGFIDPENPTRLTTPDDDPQQYRRIVEIHSADEVARLHNPSAASDFAPWPPQ